jgi:ubiquinone/menaquinone biosynthesis C-methylase UbiE
MKGGRVDPSDHARRGRTLEATIRTYDSYISSHHADRWSDDSPGMVEAIRERDEWLLRAIRPAREGTVVDIGCGDGALAVTLDAAGIRPARLVGADILERRLETARARAPWAEFVLASADDLPLDNGSAQVVVAMTLLSSVIDDWFRERIALEVDRVLEPGGRFLVYDLRYPSPRNRRVRPVTNAALRRLFPTWAFDANTMTVLPPLARSRIAGGSSRYRLLRAIPFLRSHLAVEITKPGGAIVHEAGP